MEARVGGGRGRGRASAGARRIWERYGPWTVVTGASSGIGREAASQLAAEGLNVVLVARRGEELERIATELASEHGVGTRVVAVDLAGEQGVRALIEATAELEVGLLVAAAGFGTSGRFLDASVPRELEMLEVNCRAPMLLSLHFARSMVERGRGGIVLFGSIVGFQGTPFAAHYAATKAYVQTLAEALHRELAPHGVDVVVSAPGPVHTEFAKHAGMTMGAAMRPAEVVSPTLAALGRRATVHPGLLTKVLTWSLAPLPRRVRTRIMQRVMLGMTGPTRPELAVHA